MYYQPVRATERPTLKLRHGAATPRPVGAHPSEVAMLSRIELRRLVAVMVD